jgi:peptidoglycan/LPS O-acetylase OafA/YrhL
VSGFPAARLAPAPAAGAAPGSKDLALEGLRGICACLVLYGHMTAPMRRLDPAYAPSERFWWFNLGLVAVFFFFVLSGYVIGLTVRAPFCAGEVRGYLGRRLVRLLPISTAAVLLAWLLLPQVAPRVVLGNLAFLQNFKPYPILGTVEVMPDNLNLWSLNFEALYYLAFLLVWWLAPRVFWAAGLLVAVTVAAAALPGDHIMASSYAFGAMYWIAGLSVAWLAPVSGRPGNWPSAMLVILVMWPLAPLMDLLVLAHVPDRVGPLPMPSLHRMDLLPGFVWLLLSVTGRAERLGRALGWICLSWATLALARGLFSGGIGEPGAVACYTALLALAWMLAAWRPPAAPLARLAPLGAISFGVYAVGFPIEYGVYRAYWLPSGTPWTWALRAAILAVTTFGLAWVLERKLQPAIRRALRRRPPAASP